MVTSKGFNPFFEIIRGKELKKLRQKEPKEEAKKLYQEEKEKAKPFFEREKTEQKFKTIKRIGKNLSRSGGLKIRWKMKM
jgi:hypothetical protein